MLRYSVLLISCFAMSCASVSIKDNQGLQPSSTEQAYVYGHARFQYGGSFEIVLKNPETKKSEKYFKWWVVGPFTKPARDIFFSFPVAPGKWIFESIRVKTGNANGLYDVPVIVDLPIEIAAGKGNFLGKIEGANGTDGYEFTILSDEDSKKNVDEAYFQAQKGFERERTGRIILPSSGPFTAKKVD